MTPEQLRLAGIAARRLLDWAWAAGRRDSTMVIHGIQAVARSYSSDVAASGALLRRSIASEHLAQHGYEEAFQLANALKHVLPHDPEIVRDVYGALFGFKERSDATSPMGNSRILAMHSTRRQDYDMALYKLEQLFHQFLEHSPEHATDAAITVTEGYVRHEHDRDTKRKLVIEQFQFLGRLATLEHDCSHIWDGSSVHEKDPGLKIVGAVGPHLGTLVISAPDVAQRCLELVASKGSLAVIWRRLLESGADAPSTLGLMMRELAWASPLLTCLDTCTQAGTFLTAIAPFLSEAERTLVEETIVAIPERRTEDDLEWAESRRDILLGCLPRDLLMTEAVRARLEALDAAGSAPENVPAFRIEVGWGGPVTTDGWLEREGVDVKAPAHRALLDLGEELKSLSLSQADIDGDMPASTDVAIKIRSMVDALHDGEKSVDSEVLKAGWGSVAETALRVARLKATCGKAIVALARNVLLEAGTRPPRRAEPAVDSQFDEYPGWSTPAPRVTGAEGLILLARHPDCIGPDLLDSIEQLSRDADPAVRLQISTHLWLMHQTAPDLLWSIAEQMVSSDRSAAVLQALVGHSLGRIWRLDPPRVVRLTSDLLSRFRSGPGVSRLRDSCLQLIAGLHVWQETPEATQALGALLNVHPVDLGDAAHLCTELRVALLTEKGQRGDDPDGAGVRRRAIELIHRVLEPATLEVLSVRGDTRLENQWSPEEKERLRSLVQFADLVARELYYATGIFDERTKGDDAKVPTPMQRKRFFEEARPLLEMVADQGIPAATHHLLEMLEHYIDHAPREAFLLIVRALRAGAWGGYEYESMGQDLFVRLVERYLAEHRRLFQEDQGCQSGMLAVLDIFVRAGWPSAQRLSYRLDEIFR